MKNNRWPSNKNPLNNVKSLLGMAEDLGQGFLNHATRLPASFVCHLQMFIDSG